MPTRTARLVPALLVTVMGASVATGQRPPGFVDPMPVLDAAANAIGSTWWIQNRRTASPDVLANGRRQPAGGDQTPAPAG